MAELVGVLLTLVITLAVVAASAVAALLPIVITGVVFLVWWKGGGTLVISGPLAGLLAQQGGASTPKVGSWVKRATCSSCGAPRRTPSRSAWVYCDHCGQLMDWDFRAAMSDPRSRAPGPAYEALLARLGPRLEEAKATGDRDAYRGVQEELWQAYVEACPAACPPRVGDPDYRSRFVAWSARSQTEQDLDPGCMETRTAQDAATGRLRWDRSNPFQPRVERTSFRALLDAVLAHQQRVAARLEEVGLLAEHPDRPPAEVLTRVGTSAFVQGWMPYLPPGEHDALVTRAGLQGDYVPFEQVDLEGGACPGCGASLEVLPDAQRVVCTGCGRMLAVRGGALPCHGCGRPIEVPPGHEPFACPSCDVRLERLGGLG